MFEAHFQTIKPLEKVRAHWNDQTAPAQNNKMDNEAGDLIISFIMFLLVSFQLVIFVIWLWQPVLLCSNTPLEHYNVPNIIDYKDCSLYSCWVDELLLQL